jgi:hypothetical protein
MMQTTAIIFFSMPLPNNTRNSKKKISPDLFRCEKSKKSGNGIPTGIRPKKQKIPLTEQTADL